MRLEHTETLVTNIRDKPSRNSNSELLCVWMCATSNKERVHRKDPLHIRLQIWGGNLSNKSGGTKEIQMGVVEYR